MSWAIGFDEHWGRDVGYAVPSTCDHRGCGRRINRGLAHVCGNDPFGGERGCGLFFCSDHHDNSRWRKCSRCARGREPFKPKPDVPEWVDHKAKDPSWAEWRAQQELPNRCIDCLRDLPSGNRCAKCSEKWSVFPCYGWHVVGNPHPAEPASDYQFHGDNYQP